MSHADNLMAAISGMSLATSLQRVRYQGYVQHGIQFESAHRGANCNTLHQAMQVVNLNLVDPTLQHTGYEFSTSLYFGNTVTVLVQATSHGAIVQDFYCRACRLL